MKHLFWHWGAVAIYGFLAFVAMTVAAYSQVEYDYTGNPLAATVQYGTPYVPSSVQGSVLLASALNPNQADQVVTPLFYQFNALYLYGLPASPAFGTYQFDFSTQNGAITAWDVSLYGTAGPGSNPGSRFVTLDLSSSTGDAYQEMYDVPSCGAPGAPGSTCRSVSAFSTLAGLWRDPPSIPGSVASVGVPELDPLSAIAQLSFLSFGLAVIVSRTKH